MQIKHTVNLMRYRLISFTIAFALLATTTVLHAQSVCLPAPRLLTTMPMGGQQGTSVDVTITGDHLEDIGELLFSHPGLSATAKFDATGLPVANTFTVTITAECPLGIHEARVQTRLGVSSSRVFNVGSLPEVTRTTPNTTLESAVPLEVDAICNAHLTKQAVDFYTFTAKANERVVVDCAAKGIDSKLQPVLIVADENGNDLIAQRRGGAVDFTVPTDGTFVIKVHDLTFNGGAEYFYRLALQSAVADEIVPRLASTESVQSFSWPPTGLAAQAAMAESEPNGRGAAQTITLPCDIAGSFFPAADVDVFEFDAKAGEVWWVEVASDRLGLPTDPAIIVQHVSTTTGEEVVTEVVELSDIDSPVKVSTNHYAYNGPVYNAGSTDILGKIEIKQDGKHRLQLMDLFGGTRSIPENEYRLIIRQAQPDFAVIGWALHFELRNGDRNDLSKPIALRGGALIPFEVVVIRRDGFGGEIDLELSNLPEGVTATGLKIPAGKSRGILLISADANAPAGLSTATFIAKGTINGEAVTREGRFASMAWPVKDHWQEIPYPRLLADIPVSVSTSEHAPISIAATEDKLWEVTAGEKLTIPLVHQRRCEFSGNTLSVKTFGEGFESNAAFKIPLDKDASEAILDTAKLKTPPGEYTIAFYGGAVAKYQDNLPAVAVAEEALKQAQNEVTLLADRAKSLAEQAQATMDEEKGTLEESARDAQAKQKAAQDVVTAAEKALQQAQKNATPKDIVDIVVSSPIRIRVNPAQAEAK